MKFFRNFRISTAIPSSNSFAVFHRSPPASSFLNLSKLFFPGFLQEFLLREFHSRCFFFWACSHISFQDFSCDPSGSSSPSFCRNNSRDFFRGFPHMLLELLAGFLPRYHSKIYPKHLQEFLLVIFRDCFPIVFFCDFCDFNHFFQRASCISLGFLCEISPGALGISLRGCTEFFLEFLQHSFPGLLSGFFRDVPVFLRFFHGVPLEISPIDSCEVSRKI